MDSDVTEVNQVQEIYCEPKGHDAICCELMNVSDKIVRILPAIESARPGSSSGIQLLCSLTNTVEKSKQLVHYCSESSKLYLAITAKSIVLRCERIRTQLNQCLRQIQTMVPPLLAMQIAEVLDYLRDVKFIINPVEEEAGKILLNILAEIDSSKDQEFEAFRIVASRLNITSSKALLVERRAIKKLLDKFLNVDDKKERILKDFLYLIKKHGKQLNENTKSQNNCLNERKNSQSYACIIGDNIQPHPNNVEVQSELFTNGMPPEEFCCPISSKLMYDPVVVASGQTYERICIEKWFSEGHDICPKTQKKLEILSMVPNSCMKDLISSWCQKHGVIILDPCTQPEEADIQSLEAISCNLVSSLTNISTSLLDEIKGDCLLERGSNISYLSSGSCCCSDSSHVKDIESSNNNHDQLFSWSDDYRNFQSFSNFSLDMHLRFFSGLSELPTSLQAKEIEEIKNLLEGDEMAHYDMLSSGFHEALVIFLKNACSLSDLQAQRSGAQIFIALMTNKRWELTFEKEDLIQLLSFFLNCGIDKEALLILQKVALHTDTVSCIFSSDIPLKIIKFLKSENNEYLEISVKILSELSSHGEMKSHFLSFECIEKIAQLLSNRSLVRLCLNIMQNLVDDEEASMFIADANGCIASMAEVLEFGKPEEQEQAVTILLSLCSRNLKNCLLVLKEGVIPSLVDISVNGSAMGKENSMKLLHILRDFRHSDCLDSPQPQSKAESELVKHSVKHSKNLRSNFRSFGFLSKKMRSISKSLSLF